MKESLWGARCLICTTVHNNAGRNHAKLPHLSLWATAWRTRDAPIDKTKQYDVRYDTNALPEQVGFQLKLSLAIIFGIVGRSIIQNAQ